MDATAFPAASPQGQSGGVTAAALTAALLFALYPRHHQVVMWFGAISIGLAATLALATAVLFVRAWRDDDARAGWAAVATYTAALLAHESAIVLPLLLLALLLYLRATRSPTRTTPSVRGATGSVVLRSGVPAAAGAASIALGAPRWREALRAVPVWVWALPLASGVHLVLLAWAYRVRAATYPDSGYRFVGLGGDLAAAPLRYAAQWVAPPPWTESLTLGTLGLLLGALTLLGAAVWAWRGGALARLGLAWAALAGAPFVLFGIYGVTDRYYYLPCAGLALAAAVALDHVGGWRLPLVGLYGALALPAADAGERRVAAGRCHGARHDGRSGRLGDRAARGRARGGGVRRRAIQARGAMAGESSVRVLDGAGGGSTPGYRRRRCACPTSSPTSSPRSPPGSPRW